MRNKLIVFLFLIWISYFAVVFFKGNVEEKEPEFRESERNAKKEKLSLREKVNSFGIDLTSKLGIILLIIFIVIQIILLNEMSNY